MNAEEQITARLRGVAAGRQLHTSIEYNMANGRWSVDIKVLRPECPSETIYAACADATTLEAALSLAAQHLSLKEKQHDPKQQHLSRPVHLPSGYAWAYQLVAKPSDG